jgi:hypothetical protein
MKKTGEWEKKGRGTYKAAATKSDGLTLVVRISVEPRIGHSLQKNESRERKIFGTHRGKRYFWAFPKRKKNFGRTDSASTLQVGSGRRTSDK